MTEPNQGNQNPVRWPSGTFVFAITHETNAVMVGASKAMISNEGMAVAINPFDNVPMSPVNHKLKGTAAMPTPAVAPRSNHSDAGACLRLEALGANDPLDTGTSGASNRALEADAAGAASTTTMTINALNMSNTLRP
jgi:hypothetical protein